MILVACALPAELQYFEPPGGFAILAYGVGPVEAAAGTARELAHRPYDAVIHAGIAGAYRTRARIGEARLVTNEALADFGLEGGGAPVLPAGARLVEKAAADAALVARLEGTLPLAAGLTVFTVTTTEATATRLHDRYAHDVETMEGFAVLRAAAAAGVPAVGVRGVSNYIGDRATSGWDFEAGARATAGALEAVVARLAAVRA